MGKVGGLERVTQNRVVELFQHQLEYRYLGNWEKRPNNSNIEADILGQYLAGKGYSETLINTNSTKPLPTKPKASTISTKKSMACYATESKSKKMWARIIKQFG